MQSCRGLCVTALASYRSLLRESTEKLRQFERTLSSLALAPAHLLRNIRVCCHKLPFVNGASKFLHILPMNPRINLMFASSIE